MLEIFEAIKVSMLWNYDRYLKVDTKNAEYFLSPPKANGKRMLLKVAGYIDSNEVLSKVNDEISLFEFLLLLAKSNKEALAWLRK